ncbi:putative epoxide hydrolase [Triangularia setosa]|uniref:Epoxide hydrolase n=1 Tax=Triangularia setosa TaxID=2587417 RepID=A0AAN6WC66_9PEZI|nr:putative epoxide hydrolase [Podospora setosa]
MLDLIRSTHLPAKLQYPGVGSSMGIDLDTLKALQQAWLHDFDWDREQTSINQFRHYTASIEGLKIHFIHEKSKDPNAIPLLLCHGWPGSFLEFIPTIRALTQPANSSTSKNVSFDIVIPSLPGFAFSSSPPQNWTLDDTARVYNTLMTKVLGYDTYAVHGTAHGVAISFTLYDEYNTTARAAHLVFMFFYPTAPEEIAARNISLSPLEQFELQRSVEWGVNGMGYFAMQTTKPNTIGLALHDNPVGQLAWIGDKYIDWSDPRAGTHPSVLTKNEILRCVSLYYLTGTFLSSIYIYAQDPGAFEKVPRRARTDAPLLVSFFKYNTAFWPREVIATVGNMTEYKNHDFGGTFAGLDNPPALIQDLREISRYWSN